MNVIGPGLLDAVTKASLTADLVSFAQDPDTSTSVIITTPSSATYAPASGTYTPASTPDTVDAHLAPLTAREVDASALYQEGDHKLIIAVSDLTTTPRTDSTATIASVVWRVVTVETDGINAMHRFVIRLSS